MLIRIGLCCFLISLLSACAHRPYPAPVEELRWKPASRYSQQHRVAAGETLYAVAFRYDLDYRQLAIINGLHRPYTLHVGQKLILHSRFSAPRANAWQSPRKIVSQKSAAKHPQWRSYATHNRSSNWYWPAHGRIVTSFLPAQGKKGIDIAGKKGEKIHAAADGVVAYAGGGLQGYGNLIIIRHNKEFLTAYGNNAKNLVKEGQFIKAGQVIGEMGIIDRRFWGMHFEMRKAGNPINPLQYLRRR